MSSQASRPPAAQRSGAYARRHLRSALRRHRENDAGLTQKQVGEALDWSPAKIMRIEKGHVGVSRQDLEALLNLYGILDPPQRQALLELLRQGRAGRSRIAPFRAVLSKTFADYLEEEEAASTISNYEPFFVPGPLQTAAYARTMIDFFGNHEPGTPPTGDPDEAAGVLDQRVQARLTRQEFLTASRDLTGYFVLTESALRRTVGGAEVMAGQLEALSRLAAEHDNIHIQVMPDSAGLFRFMRFPFTILEFDTGDERLMLRELQADEQTLREDSGEVGRALAAFDDMRELAHPEAEFAELAAAAIRQLR